LFAVMSWDSLFPDRRDVLVLSPLPVRATTLFASKVAAVATALGLTVVALNAFTGLTAPFAFAAAPTAPPPRYDAAIAPLEARDLQPVMDRDLAPALAAPDGALAPRNGAGLAIGVVKHGNRRVFAYGAAKPDSIYGIGSITKTFTALVLARMVVEGRVRLEEPVRNLLPPGVVSKPTGPEITLLDLATHHSGLPLMPDNFDTSDYAHSFAEYHAADLYAYMAKRGASKPGGVRFRYSNLGFGLLGEALAHRAGTSYANLLKEEITGPLGMTDTTTIVPPEQRERLIQAYNEKREPTPVWALDALAGAGVVRSTAGDMLSYLQSQLHPEKLPASLGTLRDALLLSHRLRADAGSDSRIALSWMFDPEKKMYWHNGAISGYTANAFFNPEGDFAAVALFNTARSRGFCELVCEHIFQRLTGRPAVSLASAVVPGSGGVVATLRSFAAFWFTMLASGAFLIGGVLTIQGLAQLLPRQLFLRVSSLLQIAFFILLLTVYFLQPGFSDMETLVDDRGVLQWLPSYWFFGLFQQCNGPVRPEVAVFAHRAWIGLATAVCGAAAAYLVCYWRTLRKIAEQPDILPASHRFHWLPRFGGAFETAVGQFSVRSLMRSRQHRVLWSFYLGSALGLALFISKVPVLRSQRPQDLWFQVNAHLLLSSVLIICAVVTGTRVVFALPLAPRAQWIFRVMPLPAMPQCLPAIRRALYALALAPLWLAFAVFFFAIWPWRIAAGHLVLLALIGMIVAELWLYGFQKIPFTCSWQPGKSKFNIAFLIGGGLLFLISRAASLERSALENAYLYAAVAGALAVLAILLRLRTDAGARSESAGLQFDDPPEPTVLTLGLYRDGVLPMEPTVRDTGRV